MREIFKNLQCRVYLAWDHDNHESVSITGPDDVYELVKDELAGADRERFLSILLSTRNMVIGIETVGIGTINTCMVTARELFTSALLDNAHSIILCHNHPSGDLTPSDDDIAPTKRIVAAGELLGIDVCDHLIVGRDGYRSLKQMNLMHRSILSMTLRSEVAPTYKDVIWLIDREAKHATSKTCPLSVVDPYLPTIGSHRNTLLDSHPHPAQRAEGLRTLLGSPGE
jgi:hypothetical protein